MAKIAYLDEYLKKASKFIRHHKNLEAQYEKTMQLLELNPYHPSLRLHKLKEKLKGLSAISINLSYRVILHFFIKNDIIYPIDIGTHDEVYR